jgi:DGQHR domain-containing protein
MSVLTLSALRAVQNSHIMFLVSIPAAKLKQLNLKVERFDSTLVERLRNEEITKEEYLAQQGYQRTVDNNRANKFAAYLQQETAISPTVLLINDRNGACTFNEKTGMLTFDTKSALFIYDGQHRDKGIEKALSLKADLADFPVFAVITSELPKLKEMTQFKVINGTAKGVKTNLVIEIMTAIQTEEAEVSVKDAKQIACNHATHEINRRDGSPWKGMVALANTTKPKKSEINVSPELEHQRIIGSQSFLRSLQPIHDYLEANKWPTVRNGTLKTPSSLLDRGKKIADIVVEFWQAVQSQMPEPFETPEDYVLHGSMGVLCMHTVLASLLGDMYTGRRQWVTDEFITMTSGSEWFTDAGQWEKDGGEAATYSGYGGTEKLAALIIESLVPMPVDK